MCWCYQEPGVTMIKSLLCQCTKLSLSRLDGRSGGLSMLVTIGIQCDVLHEFTFSSNCCAFLTVISHNIVFSSFYRPSLWWCAFLTFIEHFLYFVTANKYTVICGRDFNIDMLGDSRLHHDIEVLLSFHGCHNLTWKQQHISGTTSLVTPGKHRRHVTEQRFSKKC